MNTGECVVTWVRPGHISNDTTQTKQLQMNNIINNLRRKWKKQLLIIMIGWARKWIVFVSSYIYNHIYFSFWLSMISRLKSLKVQYFISFVFFRLSFMVIECQSIWLFFTFFFFYFFEVRSYISTQYHRVQ